VVKGSIIEKESTPPHPPRPTTGARPTLTEAVRALRLGLGDTQQKFATRLGIAISTAVRYESTRAPSGEILSKLYWLAVNSGLSDVAAMFHRAVFDKWREWASVPGPGLVAANLENRFIQALADNLATRGAAPSRLAEWSFMRCAQKILQDDKYKHLRVPFSELVAPMCEELVEEAKQALSVMLDGAPMREELTQALMVRFVELLPTELLQSPRARKKEKSK
jgi:transcriptional regulator with XRE-family HTH domain